MSARQRSNKRQNEVRKELLFFLRGVLTEENMLELLSGAMADAYITALRHFRSRLDLHNKNLLSNLEFQVEALRTRRGVTGKIGG